MEKNFKALLAGPTKVITGVVRASFAHVFEPTVMGEGPTPKYSLSLVIDKSDTDTVEAVKQAIRNAIETGQGKLNLKSGEVVLEGANDDPFRLSLKVGGKPVMPFKLPMRDGDNERPDDDNYSGKVFINASSTTAPQVIGLDGVRITTAEGFYSGCYCRASINFYALM